MEKKKPKKKTKKSGEKKSVYSLFIPTTHFIIIPY